jgi:hypothetical protein
MKAPPSRPGRHEANSGKESITKYQSPTGQLHSTWDTWSYVGPHGESQHTCDVHHTPPCPAIIPALHHEDVVHIAREQE